jgi:hypothetical protein
LFIARILLDTFLCGEIVKTEFAPNAWADLNKLPKFIGLDIFSAPIEK